MHTLRTQIFCQELCETRARCHNPPLLQSTGGSCVIHSMIRRGADLHNRTADALAFHNFYFECLLSFPFNAQDPGACQSHLFSLTLPPGEEQTQRRPLGERCRRKLYPTPTALPLVHSSDAQPQTASIKPIPWHRKEALGPHCGGPTHPGCYDEMTAQLSFTKGTLSYTDWIFKTKLQMNLTLCF